MCLLNLNAQKMSRKWGNLLQIFSVGKVAVMDMVKQFEK
jgi:hypothetical protein